MQTQLSTKQQWQTSVLERFESWVVSKLILEAGRQGPNVAKSIPPCLIHATKQTSLRVKQHNGCHAGHELLEAGDDSDEDDDASLGLQGLTFGARTRQGGDPAADGAGRLMKRPKLDNQKSPKLACPFLKHDPERYRTYKSCTWSGWPTVHRVKEHLFRKHLMPQFTCTRCSQAFASQLQLSNHLRNEILCPITPQTQDGIDADQLRLLRSRKGQGGVSEEEKWVKMYLIIFPDDDAVPSPYHDSSDNVSGESPCPAEPDCKQFEQLRQYLVQEAPGLLQSRLKTLLNGTRQDDVDDGKLKEFAEDFCAELNRNFDVGDTSPRSEKPSTTKATSEQSDYMSGGLTTGNSSGLDLTWPQLDVLSQSYVGTSRTLQPPALANDFGFDFLLGNPDSLLQMDDQSHLQPPGQ